LLAAKIPSERLKYWISNPFIIEVKDSTISSSSPSSEALGGIFIIYLFIFKYFYAK